MLERIGKNTKTQKIITIIKKKKRKVILWEKGKQQRKKKINKKAIDRGRASEYWGAAWIPEDTRLKKKNR